MAFQDRAMLVSMRLTCWTGKKSDRAAARELVETKQAQEGSASVIVKLVPKEALKEIRAIDARLRAVHHHYTLPWLDGGLRVLPTTTFLEHSEHIGKLLREREGVIEAVAEVYPQHKADAKGRLGDLYDPTMWPDDIRAEFTQSVRHLPIPSGADFRADMDPDDVARLREEIEGTVNEQLAAAMASIRTRTGVALNRFIERVQSYKVTATDTGVKTTGIFRDTVMDDMRSLVDVIAKLNLTGDPEVTEIERVLRHNILAYSPDTLRADPRVRAKVVADAKELASTL